MPCNPDDEKIESINQQLILLFNSHSNLSSLLERSCNVSMILLSRTARNALQPIIVAKRRTMVMIYFGGMFMVSEIKELVVCLVIQIRQRCGWFDR